MMFRTKQQQQTSRDSQAVPGFQQFSVVVLASAMLSLSGCFSIIRGTDQSLEVDTEVYGEPLAGATCIIKQGSKHWSVVTPGKVKVPRDKLPLHVTCSKDGYRLLTSSDIAADGSLLTSAAGGALAGGTIGAIGMGVASAPFLVVPVLGWATFAASIAAGAGAGALAGGAVSAGTDAADGASNEYKSPITIPMVPVPANPAPP